MRAKRGSKARRKKKDALGRASRRSAIRLRNTIHRITTDIVQNHSANLVAEDLYIGNLTRSGNGTVEAPGRDVTQKAGLKRSILEQGLGSSYSSLPTRLKVPEEG